MKSNVPQPIAKFAQVEALVDMAVAMVEAPADMVEAMEDTAVVVNTMDIEAKEVQVDMVEVIFVFKCTYTCALPSKNKG